LTQLLLVDIVQYIFIGEYIEKSNQLSEEGTFGKPDWKVDQGIKPE